MSSDLSFTPRQFDAVFPFHVGFDRAGVITTLGRSLRRLAPHARPGGLFADVLQPHRPEGPLDPAQLATADRQLFILREPRSGTLLRGQMQAVGQAVFFLGSPWLDSAAALEAHGLTLDDFAVHDPTLDLLHLLELKKIASEDLQRLATRLTAQADQLRTKESEARKLALVAARTDNAVVITNPAGEIEWVNEGFTRITGYILSECAGRKPGSFLQGPETDPATVAYMREHVARGEGFRTEILNYHKSRRPYWLAIEVQAMRDATGRLVNFMAIESDITARRHAEAALREHSAGLARTNAELAQLTRMKSAFLASMSHELRTPLTGILGMSETLLEQAYGPLNEQQRRFVGIVESSGRHLLTLINNLLDLARIEAGQLELERELYPLSEVCETAVRVARDLALRRGQTVHYANNAAGTQLRIDPARMIQVLNNLLANSAKFSADGGEFGLEVRPEGAGIKLIVWDRGIGIAPEQLPRLFQTFVQLDDRLARKYAGVGLGLALTKYLVEMHGGRIDVQSEVGAGTTFTVTLPRDTGSEPARPA